MNINTFISNNTGNAIDAFLLWKAAHRYTRQIENDLGRGHLTKEELGTIINHAATRLGINKANIINTIHEAIIRTHQWQGPASTMHARTSPSGASSAEKSSR